MKYSYLFFYEDNIIACHVMNEKNEKITLYGENALKELKRIDKSKYNNIQIRNKKIVLKNDKYYVSIQNFDELYNDGYCEYLEKTMPKIKKAISKYQRSLHTKTTLKNVRRKGYKVVAGGLVLALLNCGAVKANSLLNEDTTQVSMEELILNTYPLDEEIKIQEEITYDNSNIEIENNVDEQQKEEIIQDTNSLVEELNIENNDNNIIEENLKEAEQINEETVDNTQIDIVTEKENIQNEDDYSDEESIENYLNELKALENELDENTVDNNNYTDANTTFLDYESERYSDKGNYAYDSYSDIVNMYSEKWGISSTAIMAMLTQESGGEEINLMQIQFSSWHDQILKSYNFRDNKYEYFVLTKDPQRYYGKNVVCITPEDLKSPITNISIGCVLLRYSAERMNYHIGASIQCYNFGSSNMQTVLDLTSKQTDKTVDEILNDQTNLSFMDYTHIIDCGDSNYLNHVIRYVDPNSSLSIKYLDNDGNVCENNISILPESQSATMSIN